ncbi:N-alpha-acetyltransferase 30 [Spiromyces aspiralis]|uniref:N-alpha-acetyltransferase 30 n=1 Tax=Spiromyces aspiralis TaxID=68401 RepID=A0ACC1HLT3_9FUNG|nr:N-alpha-acetyltransferase 30 [Spiromyces aspiralis]
MGKIVGVIISKLDKHQRNVYDPIFPRTKAMLNRGYIAMLVISPAYRRHGIASTLIKKSIAAMVESQADEVVMETEVTNGRALALYERLGFIRDKRLHRYYLNGADAYRLKLWLPPKEIENHY